MDEHDYCPFEGYELVENSNYLYYDGPHTFVCKDQLNNMYLATRCDNRTNMLWLLLTINESIRSDIFNKVISPAELFDRHVGDIKVMDYCTDIIVEDLMTGEEYKTFLNDFIWRGKQY